MQDEKKSYWHIYNIGQLRENNLVLEDGSLVTISIVDSCDEETEWEIMIYLCKKNAKYEITIFKSSPDNYYRPRVDDKVRAYKETDKRVVLLFDELNDAQDFLKYMLYRHEEFRVRPVNLNH